MTSRKICAVIPAYNERGRVSNIVKVLRSLLKYVLVVDDGSTDGTAIEASSSGAIALLLPENMGKKAALETAAKYIKNFKYVLLFDADLVGLERQHIYQLIEPVVSDEVDIAIGLLVGGRFFTHFAQRLVPHLSGQRAMPVSLFIKFLDEYRTVEGYGIESAMKDFAKRYNFRVTYIELWGVAQIMKEEKYGLRTGTKLRAKMYKDILYTIFEGLKSRLVRMFWGGK